MKKAIIVFLIVSLRLHAQQISNIFHVESDTVRPGDSSWVLISAADGCPKCLTDTIRIFVMSGSFMSELWKSSYYDAMYMDKKKYYSGDSLIVVRFKVPENTPTDPAVYLAPDNTHSVYINGPNGIEEYKSTHHPISVEYLSLLGQKLPGIQAGMFLTRKVYENGLITLTKTIKQ